MRDRQVLATQPLTEIQVQHVFFEGGRFQGWLANRMGAFSVNRWGMDREAIKAATSILAEAQRPLVLFPEGTSSTGASVLPFKPALFAPVVELACPVTAVALDYELPGGSAAEEVCWGDGPLQPHVVNLFSKPTLRARVSFGASQSPNVDRKALARIVFADEAARAESAARAPSSRSATAASAASSALSAASAASSSATSHK